MLVASATAPKRNGARRVMQDIYGCVPWPRCEGFYVVAVCWVCVCNFATLACGEWQSCFKGQQVCRRLYVTTTAFKVRNNCTNRRHPSIILACSWWKSPTLEPHSGGVNTPTVLNMVGAGRCRQEQSRPIAHCRTTNKGTHLSSKGATRQHTRQQALVDTCFQAEFGSWRWQTIWPTPNGCGWQRSLNHVLATELEGYGRANTKSRPRRPSRAAPFCQPCHQAAKRNTVLMSITSTKKGPKAQTLFLAVGKHAFATMTCVLCKEEGNPFVINTGWWQINCTFVRSFPGSSTKAGKGMGVVPRSRL